MYNHYGYPVQGGYGAEYNAPHQQPYYSPYAQPPAPQYAPPPPAPASQYAPPPPAPASHYQPGQQYAPQSAYHQPYPPDYLYPSAPQHDPHHYQSAAAPQYQAPHYAPQPAAQHPPDHQHTTLADRRGPPPPAPPSDRQSARQQQRRGAPPPPLPNEQPPPPKNPPVPPSVSEKLSEDKYKNDERYQKLQEEKADLLQKQSDFETQYSKWESDFNEWKSSNINHPDQDQLKTYSDQHEQYREKLLQAKREIIESLQQLREREANLRARISAELHNMLPLPAGGGGSTESKVTPTVDELKRLREEADRLNRENLHGAQQEAEYPKDSYSNPPYDSFNQHEENAVEYNQPGYVAPRIYRKPPPPVRGRGKGYTVLPNIPPSTRGPASTRGKLSSDRSKNAVQPSHSSSFGDKNSNGDGANAEELNSSKQAPAGTGANLIPVGPRKVPLPSRDGETDCRDLTEPPLLGSGVNSSKEGFGEGPGKKIQKSATIVRSKPGVNTHHAKEDESPADLDFDAIKAALKTLVPAEDDEDCYDSEPRREEEGEQLLEAQPYQPGYYPVREHTRPSLLPTPRLHAPPPVRAPPHLPAPAYLDDSCCDVGRYESEPEYKAWYDRFGRQYYAIHGPDPPEETQLQLWEREFNSQEKGPDPKHPYYATWLTKFFGSALDTVNSAKSTEPLGIDLELPTEGDLLPMPVPTELRDIIELPGRNFRPKKLVIVLRGPPGSGKSFLARLIKEREVLVSDDSRPPRILSIDDYFLSEVNQYTERNNPRNPDAAPLRKNKIVEYEYDAAMESAYQQCMFKCFKKSLDNDFFPFLIVDNTNHHLAHFEQYFLHAKLCGYTAYLVELKVPASLCFKRNIHKRSSADLETIITTWEDAPEWMITLEYKQFLEEFAEPQYAQPQKRNVIPESELYLGPINDSPSGVRSGRSRLGRVALSRSPSNERDSPPSLRPAKWSPSQRRLPSWERSPEVVRRRRSSNSPRNRSRSPPRKLTSSEKKSKRSAVHSPPPVKRSSVHSPTTTKRSSVRSPPARSRRRSRSSSLDHKSKSSRR